VFCCARGEGIENTHGDGACVELCNRIMYFAVFILGNDMIGSSMAT
jgi:hypothetical protein